MTDDVQFIRMVYMPQSHEIRVTTLFPPVDPEIWVHPKALAAHQDAGWIVPPKTPRRRSTDR